MATKHEMRVWFEDRYESSVDAFFHDTRISDMQRVAATIDVRKALAEHFPASLPTDIEELAEDLDREGAWIDAKPENSSGPDLV